MEFEIIFWVIQSYVDVERYIKNNDPRVNNGVVEEIGMENRDRMDMEIEDKVNSLTTDIDMVFSVNESGSGLISKLNFNFFLEKSKNMSV